MQRPRVAKTYLKKMNNLRRLKLLYFKTIYEAIVVKTK